jgi:hypothetical protein
MIYPSRVKRSAGPDRFRGEANPGQRVGDPNKLKVKVES